MLAVTARGMNNVVWDLHERDFEFIVDGVSYCVSSVIAEFASPKVSRMRRGDATVSRYTLNVSDKSRIFDQFLHICMGDSIEVTSDNADCLMCIARDLENTELLDLIVSSVETLELDVTTAIDTLVRRQAIGLDIEAHAALIAENFYRFPAADFLRLDVDTMSHILSLKSLHISSEDSLYQVIKMFLDTVGLSAVCLFEFVHFEYLSEECLADFVALSERLGVDWMNAKIWGRICHRLLLSPSSEKILGGQRLVDCRDRHFAYNGKNPLNGIIAHLTKQVGKNLVDANAVQLTTSHTFEPASNPKHILDFFSNAVFKCTDAPNLWVALDFGKMRILPTHYSIDTDPCNGARGLTPRSWVLEGSDDGTVWTQLDKREDDITLNGMGCRATYSVPSQTRSFQHLRLRQTGPNHWGSYTFAIAAFEVFGDISYG